MNSAYARLAERLLTREVKPKVFCKFDGVKLHIGTQSTHKTVAGRMWRTFWRLKINRENT